MLAKFLLVEIDERAAMPALFLPHLLEDLRGAGEVFLQAHAEVGVDAFVFLLQRNRQSKNFFLRQAVEVSHEELLGQQLAISN